MKLSDPNIGVVISRFNEDISWSYGITHKKYLYNKGNDIDLSDNSISPYIIEVLPNVGRESQTYLHHIVKNYDNLDEFTFFLQGDPSDHGYPENFPSVENINDFKVESDFFPLLLAKDNFQYCVCTNLGAPHIDLDMEGFFNLVQLDDLKEHQSFSFSPGACFGISKEKIHTRSKEVYQRLLNVLSDPEHNWRYGHIMERIWKYLFNC
jgi:hypothetical protein